MGRGSSKAGGGKGGGSNEMSDLQSHFDKENERIAEFMESKGYDSIEMDNGQILEHYTLKDAKSQLKEFKQDGEMYQDYAVSIQYTDGTIKNYVGGDDTSNIKLTNINGVILDNPMTTGYAGKGIKIENYKELYPTDYPDSKGYEDDWRIDFEYPKRSV